MVDGSPDDKNKKLSYPTVFLCFLGSEDLLEDVFKALRPSGKAVVFRVQNLHLPL